MLKLFASLFVDLRLIKFLGNSANLFFLCTYIKINIIMIKLKTDVDNSN